MNKDLLHKDFVWNGTSFNKVKELQSFVASKYPELSEFINEWFGESGIIHCHTSGSTGAPKRMGLKRGHMVNSAKATGQYFKVGARSNALLCLPLGFIAGRMMLVRAMVLGWNLELVNPGSVIAIKKHENYDFSAMVPLQLYHSKEYVSNIKTLIVGGGIVSNALLQSIKTMPTKIFATYGMTETVSHVAVCPLNNAAGYSGKELIYEALPEVSFSTDARQCLTIDARKVAEDIIVTNDVVKLRSNQSFEWLARYDHVINSGGLKFFPEQIEKKLESFVEDTFFIAGLKDEALGEKIVLFVEGNQNNQLLTTLKEYQNKNPEKLSDKEIPRDIYFIKSFERTPTNKINRKATVKSYFKTA